MQHIQSEQYKQLSKTSKKKAVPVPQMTTDNILSFHTLPF
jgi:protein TIF31